MGFEFAFVDEIEIRRSIVNHVVLHAARKQKALKINCRSLSGVVHRITSTD